MADVGMSMLEHVGDIGSVVLGILRDGGDRQEYELSISDWQSDVVAKVDMCKYFGFRHGNTVEARSLVLSGLTGAVVDNVARVVGYILAFGRSLFASFTKLLKFPCDLNTLHGRMSSCNSRMV